MSKITVITDTAGKIVVIAHGHQTAHTSKSRQPHASVRAGHGQQLHELDVPEDLGQIKTWSELHDKVQPYLKRA